MVRLIWTNVHARQVVFITRQASTPRGASFNSEKVCLSDTRTVLLDEVWFWIKSIEVKKTAEIL